VLALPQVQILDEAHAREHSLEVHLPFLQEVLGDFTLIPLVVGTAAPEDVSAVLNVLWGGPETLIVIGSDLSHYYDYTTARRLDQATSRAIEALRPQDLGAEQACGHTPIRDCLKSWPRVGGGVRSKEREAEEQSRCSKLTITVHRPIWICWCLRS
jgi:MEMO1 family protein